MLVGGAENPPLISFSLPDLHSFPTGEVSAWLSQGHRRQGSRGPSVSSWGQRAGAPLVVAMAAGAIPTPGSGKGTQWFHTRCLVLAPRPAMHCLLEGHLPGVSLPLKLLWVLHFQSNSTTCTMECKIFGINSCHEVPAFPLPTFSTSCVASGFTRLGYDPEQTF